MTNKNKITVENYKNILKVVHCLRLQLGIYYKLNLNVWLIVMIIDLDLSEFIIVITELKVSL